MNTRLYGAAIEFNTLLDRDAPVAELQIMARFDANGADAELYSTPVSGDALRRNRVLGETWARASLMQWNTQ